MDLILINNDRRIIILKFFELFYIPFVPLRYVLLYWERSADEPMKSLRTCIHKRLSKVWEWEIMTIVSAEDTVIS